MNNLVIQKLLDFSDLIAKVEIKFEVLFNFFNAVHVGGVILDTDFASDFVSAGAEFFRDNIHGDLAGVFDIGDTGSTTEFFGGEIVIFGDFVDDLFRRDGAEFRGLINIDRAVFD